MSPPSLLSSGSFFGVSPRIFYIMCCIMHVDCATAVLRMQLEGNLLALRAFPLQQLDKILVCLFWSHKQSSYPTAALMMRESRGCVRKLLLLCRARECFPVPNAPSVARQGATGALHQLATTCAHPRMNRGKIFPRRLFLASHMQFKDLVSSEWVAMVRVQQHWMCCFAASYFKTQEVPAFVFHPDL